MNEEMNIPQNYMTVATGYRPIQIQDVRWMFDYDYFMASLKAKLYGGSLEIGENQQYQIKTVKEAMMLNESGIEQTMGLVNGFVDKIHALSQVDEDRIMKLCLDLAISLNQFYFINMENFDISPDKASLIKRMIITLFEMNLRKSMNAQTLKLIGQTEKYIETSKLEPEKKRFLFF